MIRHRIIGMIPSRLPAQNVFLLFSRILSREDEPAPTRGKRISLSRSGPGQVAAVRADRPGCVTTAHPAGRQA
jgi:hypothetical protein